MESNIDALVLNEASNLVDRLKARNIPPHIATEIVAFTLSIYLAYWCEIFKSTDPAMAALTDVIKNTENLLDLYHARQGIL